MKNLIRCVLLGCLILVTATAAEATPTLGVATDTGIYVYTGPEPTDPYILYFASSLVSGTNEGFVLGPSGSSLTVFTSYDPSTTQIYLLADTAGGNLPMSFGGSSLTFDEGQTFIPGKADGYNATPYSYLALPTDLSSWTTHDFEETFYLYTATITYTGAWTPGYYFFAGAETNGTPGLQYTGPGGTNDDFSPKTSSADSTPVPEPATVLLLGGGLLGLAGLRRRFGK